VKLLLPINQLLFRTKVYHSCHDIQDLIFIFIFWKQKCTINITTHFQTANKTISSPDRVYLKLYHIGWSLYHNSEEWRRSTPWCLGSLIAGWVACWDKAKAAFLQTKGGANTLKIIRECLQHRNKDLSRCSAQQALGSIEDWMLDIFKGLRTECNYK